MAHDNHTNSNINKDLLEYSEEHYFELLRDWEDPYPYEVVEHEGVKVVRDDLIVGSKARFGDFFFSQIEEDTVVYVQPRVGLAGLSLLELARKYNKKVILFMPSSKEVSDHQAIVIEQGAIPKFRRIAAMPVLNKYAKDWAAENNARFIPLGLYHPHVVAGAAKVARNFREKYGTPERIYIPISTGVLCRGIEIGFGKETEIVSIAVARNVKTGEKGKSRIISEPLPFLTPERKENMPPFPSVSTYDAKVWKYALADKKENPDKNIWMWNVGKDPTLNDITIKDRIDSAREWNEVRD